MLARNRYDDGGFSGGSIERPAPQPLVAHSLLFDILTRDQIETAATGNFFAEHQRVIAHIDM